LISPGHLTVMRALSKLLRTPLGIAVVFTIALSTAACTVVLALVDAALLRPPPFPDVDRLAILYMTEQSPRYGLERLRWSFPRFRLLATSVRPSLFSELATVTRASSLTIAGDGEPEPVEGEVVTPSYFHILSTTPVLGRTLLSEADDAGTGAADVVIGADLWRRRFGGDSGVVGRRITINGVRFSIVGILPTAFHGLTGRAELWITPGMATAVSYRDYLRTNQSFISVVGRLGRGVTLKRAAAALSSVGADIQRAQPIDSATPNARFAATARSVNDARVDPTERRWVLLLLAGVGFLFLLACANVANLLIVRSLARRRELAIRSALGATPANISRVLFTEGALMAISGGMLGALVAALSLPALVVPARLISPRNMYGSIGAFADPEVDSRFVAASLLVMLVAALLCSALAAFLRPRVDLTRDLKDGAPNATLANRTRRLTTQSAIIALETALALMLLVSGGLMTESYRRLRAAPLGFDPSGLLTFWIRPSEVAYPPARAATLIERVLGEIDRVPGVIGATVDGCTPVSTGCANSTLYIVGRARPKPEDAPPVLRHYIAPEHFITLGIPVTRGRSFDSGDRAGANRVAIINELAARRFFPNEDPIGQRVWFGGGSSYDRPDSAAEIVGIVGNVAYQSLDEHPMQPDFYTPYLQFTYAARAVLVRTKGSPAALVPAMRTAVHRVDRSLALYEVRTMEGHIGDASAGRRFDTTLLSAFAAIALLLAVMGIYAVVAHAVAQRTREVGIRIALGATVSDVVTMVVREGMYVPTVGLTVGVAGSLLLTRALRAQLYGVTATNPAVYIVLTALLAIAATMACYLPAAKAAKVDPVSALKS